MFFIGPPRAIPRSFIAAKSEWRIGRYPLGKSGIDRANARNDLRIGDDRRIVAHATAITCLAEHSKILERIRASGNVVDLVAFFSA